jgi:hypothetical protein
VLQGQNFQMTFTVNGNDFPLTSNSYNNFIIHEDLHLGMYWAELKLMKTISGFKDYPLLTGLELDVNITLSNNDKLDMKFIIYDVEDQVNMFNIILASKLYATKLDKDKISKGYKDKLDNIISTIASSSGIINTEIEITSIEPRIFLQLNQTNFDFIKTNLKYMKNKNANYMFFIDKTDKLKCYSISHLKAKKSIGQFSDRFMDNIVTKDLSFSSQLMSGFGGTGYYFDWDQGSFTTVLYDQGKFTSISSAEKVNQKLGVNVNYISTNSNIMMLPSAAQDILPIYLYSTAELENSILLKQYFNVFISFNYVAGMLACSPGELVDLYITSAVATGTSQSYSGKWIVYSATHNFPLLGYGMGVTLGNAFFNAVIDPNFV